MTTLPVAGYFANPARTNGEAKAGLDDTVEVARELPGGAAETELTIAAGVVTPTAGRHTIDTEADAPTDDLTNIDQTNHPDGRLLLIRSAANGRTVVVKHAALGAGQVLLADSADFALDNTSKWLLLAEQGTDWIEVLRSHGSDKAAARAFLAAAGLTDANVFTKTQSWKQGADVASAAALVLGDGNSFDVTGVAAITSIGSKGVGTWALLQFDAALTLTHHATDLILQGGADITTAAGDLALINEYVAGKWRVFYQRASGRPVDEALASQVEMEAATAIDKVVTPGRAHNHPGVAKAWTHFTVTAGVPAIDDDYNVTSITDNGVGDFTFNFTTAFSSANYTAHGDGERQSAENVDWSMQVKATRKLAGSCRMLCTFRTGTTAQEPATGYATFFGDQ